MKTSKFLYTLAGIIAIASFNSFSYADTTTQTLNASSAVVSVESQKAEYLFVIEAKQGEISQTKNANYILTISNVDPMTLYFSDRPYRKAGYMKTQKFMEMWMKPDSSFNLNPPNAAFVHAMINADQSGKMEAIPVELKNPNVLSNGKIIFKISNIGNQKIVPGKFSKIKIFIDDNVALMLLL